MGRSWSTVRTVSGARDIYLEPVRGLQLDTILNETWTPTARSTLLARVGDLTGPVQDTSPASLSPGESGGYIGTTASARSPTPDLIEYAVHLTQHHLPPVTHVHPAG